jgi:hypothetical protein
MIPIISHGIKETKLKSSSHGQSLLTIKGLYGTETYLLSAKHHLEMGFIYEILCQKISFGRRILPLLVLALFHSF